MSEAALPSIPIFHPDGIHSSSSDGTGAESDQNSDGAETDRRSDSETLRRDRTGAEEEEEMRRARMATLFDACSKPLPNADEVSHEPTSTEEEEEEEEEEGEGKGKDSERDEGKGKDSGKDVENLLADARPMSKEKEKFWRAGTRVKVMNRIVRNIDSEASKWPDARQVTSTLVAPPLAIPPPSPPPPSHHRKRRRGEPPR